MDVFKVGYIFNRHGTHGAETRNFYTGAEMLRFCRNHSAKTSNICVMVNKPGLNYVEIVWVNGKPYTTNE